MSKTVACRIGFCAEAEDRKN